MEIIQSRFADGDFFFYYLLYHLHAQQICCHVPIGDIFVNNKLLHCKKRIERVRKVKCSQ